MKIKKVLLLVGIAALAISSILGKPEPVSSGSLVIEGVPGHPTMTLTPESVELGRENYRKYKWAKSIGNDILSSASVWLERDQGWIKSHMPGKSACFAYGFAGCPECGGKTGIWINADCSFDKPGTVRCSNGHSLPNSSYPDAGTGYRASDGRMHYFVGTYNAWAVEEFINGANALAYAYSLTGEDKYAVRCGEILDGLADIYPTCTIGSWDYPETKPNQNSGRLNRPQYQVGRILITLADTYDQIYNSPALEKASVHTGLSRKQNIDYMLLDGAWYCYNKSFNFTGLTNGEADYIKGAMVVGLVLGIPEYVRWAVDGPYGIKSMLANNIGRDGTYYETATGYSYYTRFIYRGYAEYLLNYRGSAYPNGVNLYENDKFCSFMDKLNLNTQIGGALPSYGDAAPTVKPWQAGTRPFEIYDFECLEYLRCRVEDQAKKARYNAFQNWLTDGQPEKYYRKSASANWFLFHAKPLEPGREKLELDDYIGTILNSHVLGQKGFALLRGKGSTRDQGEHGVLLRFGPSLNHGNQDDLNFTYHALGNNLTYDLGYALGSSHVYTGWSRQTVSHQLVVVDEKSQGGNGAPTGGSLKAFWQGSATAAAEASAPGGYKSENVKEYGRTLFLVENPETSLSKHTEIPNGYLVDIFRVSGGNKHDSFTHSLGRDVSFIGASAGEKTSGSLAGNDYVWGDKVLVDGDISGQPNKPYWIAPPGNGYGFLVEPQRITVNQPSWCAEWKLPESGDHVRTWFPKIDEETVETAWGPGILKDLPDAAYVVRRRTPADSQSVFVTAWEPYRDKSSIASVEEFVFDDTSSSYWPAVAVRIKHKNGREDILYCSDDEVTRKVGSVTFAGKLGRFSKHADQVILSEGLGLKSGTGSPGDADDPVRFSGKVGKLIPEQQTVETSLRIPETLSGQMIYFRNDHYTRSSAYEIESVENFSTGSLVRMTENWIIGRGVVDSIDKDNKSLVSLISHEYAKALNRKGESGFFTGKRLVNGRTGTDTRVQSMGIVQPMVIQVNSTAGFNVGDPFVYEDISAGDNFVIYRPIIN